MTHEPIHKPSPRIMAGTLALLLLVLTSCANGPSTYNAHVAPTTSSPEPAGDVLIVLSAAPLQTLADDSTRETGYFLGEFYEPYIALREAGYSVTIATIGGATPSLDPESLKEKYWEDRADHLDRARRLTETLPQMQQPATLEHALEHADQFQALIIPGGQGVMVDLLDDTTLHSLITTFAEDDRPIGFICHAPAILSRMTPTPESLEGRRVTSVSGFEERYIETMVMGAKAQIRAIGESLEDAGYRYEAALPGRAHAVRDCNLITNQNPFSSDVFNQLFLDALDDWRGGSRCADL